MESSASQALAYIRERLMSGEFAAGTRLTEERLARDIGIRFKGVEKTNVEEYCVSEGWVKVAAGNAKDRFGRPMTITLKGPVEPYVRGEATKEG